MYILNNRFLFDTIKTDCKLILGDNKVLSSFSGKLNKVSIYDFIDNEGENSYYITNIKQDQDKNNVFVEFNITHEYGEEPIVSCPDFVNEEQFNLWKMLNE